MKCETHGLTLKANGYDSSGCRHHVTAGCMVRDPRARTCSICGEVLPANPADHRCLA